MKCPNLQVLIVCVLATCALAGCANAPLAPIQIAESKNPRVIPPGAEARPIQFRRILAKLPLGEPIGQFHYGWVCSPGATIPWRGGRLNITEEELTETFRIELESNNYPVVGDPYALFGDPSSSKAEILVAGLVEKVDLRICFPFSGSPNVNVGNTNTSKGEAFMRIAWQFYSPEFAKVIYETTTEGYFKTEETISGGVPVFLKNIFAANVKNLLADPGFFTLVLKNKPPNAGLLRKRTTTIDSGMTPNPSLQRITFDDR